MKNLLQLTVILSIVIAFNLNTFGQHQFGVKVSGGLSRITDSMKSSNLTVTTPFVPSGQVGFYYNLALGNKSSLGAELNISQIEGKEKWEVPFVDEYGNSIGNATALIYRHISYLSLPVYYGYTIKRLTINGGFQISYVLSSSGTNESSNNFTLITEEGNQIIRREGGMNRELNDLDIKAFDFGPRAGFIYRLTHRLSMEGMFYYGLSNINQIKSTSEKLKIQQMTVGIRYSLWTKVHD
ncbi:MAG TPA: hypothetical protein DCL77_14145 [Prolixibacteraceae bacterium]|jgi:hypothetical protein|nr:hypothetical protein [Prolixibacteraceae bacterium]